MTTLVTGATGRFGSHLARSLGRRGDRPRVAWLGVSAAGGLRGRLAP
jgi:uncharacterized protein YbjT (DUF2867 family)